jgi:16S rRNA (adenine1518-N6/adenine1519-N6)-dimethyltransferase
VAGGARPLLTPTEVRRLLSEHGLAPSKRRGQNFVVDANVVRKLVRDAQVTEGDLVVEVGPGLGSLTLALRAVGADVVAVEVDAGLVRALGQVMGDDLGVRVVHGDILQVDLSGLVAGDARPPVLVANLPYNIATPVLMRALEAGAFRRLFVMVQREVGERWVAAVGDTLYGGVSVKVAAFAAGRLVGAVPRTAFFPVPNVDSVTVMLEPRPWHGSVDRSEVAALVDAGFAQRRKRLRNALATPGRPPAAVEEALRKTGLSPGARAEELDLAAWVALVEVL